MTVFKAELVQSRRSTAIIARIHIGKFRGMNRKANYILQVFVRGALWVAFLCYPQEKFPRVFEFPIIYSDLLRLLIFKSAALFGWAMKANNTF